MSRRDASGAACCRGGGPERNRLLRLFTPWILLGVLAAAIACQHSPTPPPGSRRLIIVGVDGATWNLLSPMMEQGRLPHLAGLYRAGSAGLLKSLEPLLPAALWTTVATGKSRGAHAIEAASEKIPGRYAARPITADRRRAPALWTIAGAHGLAVGVSNWPVTFPAEHVNGYLIAEGYDPSATGDHGFVFPEGSLGDETVKGEDLRMSEAARRVAALDAGLRDSFESDLLALSRGITLYRVYQPRLAFFRFVSIDVASHRFWQYHDTRYLELAASRGRFEDPARVTELAAALPGACEYFDEWLGLLLERLPEKSTLLIVSDHGFRGITMTDYLHVDLNGLLARLGFLSFTPAGVPDWSRTRAFSLDDVGGQRRGIYMNVKGREQQGLVDAAGAPALTERVGTALRDLKTQTGEPIFRTVTLAERPEPSEPDISVIENLGIDPAGIVRIRNERAAVTSLYRRYGEDFGAHDPGGILLAAGEGIVAGRTGWAVDLYDVVPTALRLLGLPLASDMPGQPAGEILTGPAMVPYPMVSTYNDLPPAPAPVRAPAGFAQRELNRLRAMGHLR